MFLPPESRLGRERILVYGGPGAGKSYSWIDIAMEYARRGNDGRFFVVDTDAAVEDLFDEVWPEGRDQIVNYSVSDFGELMEAAQEIRAEKPDARNGDWVVIDLISVVWDWVQDAYAEQVYGMPIEQYIAETSRLIHVAKEAGEKGHEREFGDWKPGDWNHMKKMYLGWEGKLVLRGKAHVFACAEESEMNEFVTKSRDVKTYAGTGGKIGYRPRGQNTLGHRFRTVTRVSKTGSEERGTAERMLVVAKDRYRESKWAELDETRGGNAGITLGDTAKHKGFSRSYLRRVAGWETRDE